MRIAFLLYDQLTQLDMTGPAQVLSRMPGASVDYVAKTMDPVMSDCRLALMPTLTLAESGQFDLLCVPGGYGCSAVMNDEETLGWLRAPINNAFAFVTQGFIDDCAIAAGPGSGACGAEADSGAVERVGRAHVGAAEYESGRDAAIGAGDWCGDRAGGEGRRSGAGFARAIGGD